MHVLAAEGELQNVGGEMRDQWKESEMRLTGEGVAIDERWEQV